MRSGAWWPVAIVGALGVTMILDTGLTNGTRYYYGVRARDAWNWFGTPNVTTNIDNASAIPTGGIEQLNCQTCHGTSAAVPPTRVMLAASAARTHHVE